MIDHRGPAVLYTRVAPQLRDAVNEAARRAGVSVNSFVTFVLSSAVASELREVVDAAPPAIPDDVPVTPQEHARVRRLAKVEAQQARVEWQEYWHRRDQTRAFRATPEEMLTWFRERLATRGEADRYRWRRSVHGA